MPNKHTFLELPGLRFTVQSERPVLPELLEAIFSGGVPEAAVPDAETVEVSIEARLNPRAPEAAYCELSVDGKFAYTAFSEAAMVNYLETVVTDRLARHLTGHVLFHAGALSYNGTGIVIPGASGNGKSTTTTCLALSGLTYFSDETAVCSADGERLFPFPKVPSLKPGGRSVVSENFGDKAETVFAPDDGGVTYFRPLVFPGTPETTSGVPIRYVILPRRPEGGETELEPIKKSEALRVMIEESLDIRLKHESAFNAITTILANAECYRIRMADVQRGVQLVRDLIGSN